MILSLLAPNIANSKGPNMIQNLHELFKPYEDENGVMRDRNNIIDGNALLYTGAKLVLISEAGQETAADFDVLEKALAVSEIQPGLLQRYGKPGDHEAHDDYIGMVAASARVDGGAFAKRVVSYGRRHWWCWDNVTPGKFTFGNFFVRQPGLWATMKAAADEWLNPFDQLMAFGDLIMIEFFENGSSGTLMDYLQYKTYMKNCSWWTAPLVRLGCVIFKHAYLQRHPLGIKESYLDYFGHNHPLANLDDGTF